MMLTGPRCVAQASLQVHAQRILAGARVSGNDGGAGAQRLHSGALEVHGSCGAPWQRLLTRS